MSKRRETGGLYLGRALRGLMLRVVTELIGAPASTTTEPAPRPDVREEGLGLERAQGDLAGQSVASSSKQVRALQDSREDTMETHPAQDRREETRAQELADLRRTLRGVVQRLEDALDHVGMEAQRLADENSRLALLADKLERRLEALPQALAKELRESTAEPEAAVAEEPRFRPTDDGISLELAAVPGFQAIMDMQRGLNALANVADANVLRYQNDEAALALTLDGPVTAREIVEGLQASLGYGLVIEDSRPEDLRLRLRFVAQEPN